MARTVSRIKRDDVFQDPLIGLNHGQATIAHDTKVLRGRNRKLAWHERAELNCTSTLVCFEHDPLGRSPPPPARCGGNSVVLVTTLHVHRGLKSHAVDSSPVVLNMSWCVRQENCLTGSNFDTPKAFEGCVPQHLPEQARPPLPIPWDRHRKGGEGAWLDQVWPIRLA